MSRADAQGSDSILAGTERAATGLARVYLVAAVAENGVIGANGKLPWHFPEDLQHFKRLTAGHPVIMGRKTWEAIGRPLPNRDNIVVSRRPGFAARGAQVAASLDEALALCRGRETVFVIGGSELYRAALPRAAGLVLTEIHRTYEGDARFPEFDRRAWQETRRESRFAADGTRFDFVWYVRAA
jgi:dihydrofolate reductase